MSKDNQQNIIIEQLAESKEALESIENMVSDIKVPQKMKVELEGVETITIKGDKGDKGDTGPEGKQGKQGEKGTKGDTGLTGKDGKDGKDGKIGKQGLKGDKGDKGKDGKDGIDGTNGEDGSPDTPEDIVYKINSLPENAFSPKIDASHIKNLPTQGGSAYNDRRGASVAGSDTEIQFNDSGKLGANSALTFDKDTETLTITNDKVLTSNQSALVISATAANTDSGAGLIDVRQTNTSSTKALAYLKQASTSGGARNLWLENDGTGDGLFIDQDGNAPALNIDSEATTNPAIIADIPAGDAHLRLVGDSGNASPTEGDLWRESDGLKYYDGTTEHNLLSGSTASFGITLDGQGGVISTGLKGFIEVPYTGTITGWTLVADQSGSIVIDVWKDTYANFPPTVADTIAGSEKPTLSSVQKNQDLTLTTWTTAVTAGDILAFNVDSATTVTRVNLIIRITKG